MDAELVITGRGGSSGTCTRVSPARYDIQQKKNTPPKSKHLGGTSSLHSVLYGPPLKCLDFLLPMSYTL